MEFALLPPPTNYGIFHNFFKMKASLTDIVGFKDSSDLILGEIQLLLEIT